MHLIILVYWVANNDDIPLLIGFDDNIDTNFIAYYICIAIYIDRRWILCILPVITYFALCAYFISHELYKILISSLSSRVLVLKLWLKKGHVLNSDLF